MISSDLVDEIRRLLTAGHSPTAVARKAGVHRTVVKRIVATLPPDFVRTEPSSLYRGIPERCPTCGGRVFLPCRLCRTRTILASGKEIQG